MNSKKIYEERKKELLKILENNNLSSHEKLEKIDILSLIENLEIYQTELNAQNHELIQKENELLDSRDEFVELFNFAPIAYFQLDKDFKILKNNQKAFELFQSTKLSFKLKNQLVYYIHKSDMINYINFISTLKENNFNEGVLKFYNFSNKDSKNNSNKTDEPIYGKVHIKSYKKNKSTYYLMSIIDITKEINQEAIILNQTKNSAMGEMLSMITHQWKQPLSIISVISSGIQTDIDFDNVDLKTIRTSLNEIIDQVRYMSETADDFKSFFDEDNTAQKLTIKDCVNKAVKFTSASLKDNDITLKVTYEESEDKYISYGFRNDICQILMTIINNAKDILKQENENKNKKIDLKIYKENSDIIITIKNNGENIAENIIDDIFEKNFTTKKNKIGNGLGLYIAKRIVYEHLKGKLEVKNLENENGVEFKLTIPQYKEKKV